MRFPHFHEEVMMVLLLIVGAFGVAIAHDYRNGGKPQFGLRSVLLASVMIAIVLGMMASPPRDNSSVTR